METITGFVDHIVFQNSENGYTVMILSTEGEEMTCVGMCKGLTQGENISAEGEYIEHPVYGRQFKIQSYETVTPTDRVGMERYLGSGAIRGVGEALAARIVKKFGDDTFRIIEEEPERLARGKGDQRTQGTGDRYPDGRKKGSPGSTGLFTAIRNQ